MMSKKSKQTNVDVMLVDDNSSVSKDDLASRSHKNLIHGSSTDTGSHRLLASIRNNTSSVYESKHDLNESTTNVKNHIKATTSNEPADDHSDSLGSSTSRLIDSSNVESLTTTKISRQCTENGMKQGRFSDKENEDIKTFCEQFLKNNGLGVSSILSPKSEGKFDSKYLNFWSAIQGYFPNRDKGVSNLLIQFDLT